MEEGLIRKLLAGIPNVNIEREEVLHISGGNGGHIVSVHVKEKYAEFNDDLTEAIFMDPAARPLLEYLEREGYRTNLK